MAFSNRYSSLRHQTSSSPSIDSSSTTWKRASRNSRKSVIAIQRSDHKLWPFQTVTPAWRDQTSSSLIMDSSSTTWKTASGNSSKSLIAIQRSDHKLWPFRTVNQACATRPHHHRVSIPHPPHGKGHPETPGKVWSRSNGRITSYGLFEPLIKPAPPDLIITEYRFLIHHMEKGIRKLQEKCDRDPTVGSQVMAFSNRYSCLAPPGLIITEYRFLIHHMEKGIRKIGRASCRERV